MILYRTWCGWCERRIVVYRVVACYHCGAVAYRGTASVGKVAASIVHALALSAGFVSRAELVWAVYHVILNRNEPDYSHDVLPTVICQKRNRLRRIGVRFESRPYFGWRLILS